MEYYIEYIFAENFLIDFILLYITGNLIKIKIIYKRLILAAIIGAIYVILIAYIRRPFMAYFIVKISVSILMIMVAYDTKGIIKNIKVILCFYIVTLIMVGAVFTLYSITNNRVTVNIIVISIFMVFVLLKLLFYEIKLRKEKNNYIRTVTIEVNEKIKSFRAFIDTGNELIDPMSGKPVIVVNIGILGDVLGEDVNKEILEFYKNEGKNYENLFLEKNYKLKLRVIRYNTISNKDELMICLIPDNITISGNDKNITKADAVIGIYPQKINQKEDYDALLFKKLLDWECELDNECGCY
ncbi:stage II sporulation protein GA (sporulation sigma-E factor processing peptidase) [Sedimentibacter acidaminivorans]|uniref:Sporulation sigma-E factor-processing peptidase n=1 Tax=Sedimentibacter acidaminivorans TaxID=913099 RepID=A0ABS4GI95_9FIRM|nr:sigma-E processing peptidase SpoIIGA [Sedimentibacter acidaminivorans]MBP1927408.1 stage II sporulation protein GA (sporulation sigma-E factor processing peptidase) [Sedimentibacter acidaminivorans]